MIDLTGLPVWLAETAVYLTDKEARAVRFGELPQSFKAFHAADETEAAAALVVLWAKVQGATEVDDEVIARLTQHMVVALGVESVAELIRLELGGGDWPVASVLADVSAIL